MYPDINKIRGSWGGTYDRLTNEQWSQVKRLAYKALFDLANDLKTGDYLVDAKDLIDYKGNAVKSKYKTSGKTIEHKKHLRASTMKLVKDGVLTINQASLITNKFGFMVNEFNTITPTKKYFVSEIKIDNLLSTIPKKIIKEFIKETLIVT